MSSNLTVAQARVTLGQVADPSDPNSDLFLPLLNRACEAIINAGQYQGMVGEVDFSSADGYISLPRRWISIVASRICCTAAPVYGRYREFSSAGPNYFRNLEYRLESITDQGEYPTHTAQSEALPIRLTIADADDAGRTIRLYGVDENGRTIYDENGAEGVDYTLVNPSVTTTQSFILTNVVKPITEGSVSISSVDGSDVTLLSIYEPTETNPMYRRYKVGTHEARADGYPVIRTLCKRRFIPLVNETDPVFPSNLRALRFAMNACKLEADGAYEVGESMGFWNGCFEELNNSLRQIRGNIRTPAPFMYPGSRFPTTN